MSLAILILAGAIVLPVFWVALTRDSSPHSPGRDTRGCWNRDERRREASWL